MKEELFHVRQEQNHMATTFDFRIRCREAEIARADQILEIAHQKVTELEEVLSEFKAESPIARLNRSHVGEKVSLPETALELLSKSLQVSAITQGAFDPFAKGGSKEEVIFLSDKSAIIKTDPRVVLSFGAIGKGYALDAVSELIEKEGFQNYTLNAGGSSIILSGFSHSDESWNWAWSWKKDLRGNSLGLKFKHSTGQKVALGISGTHEKGSHLIDRRKHMGKNGKYPTPLKSALVAHEKATEADALSTALYVAGWDEGMKFLTHGQATAAAVIDEREIPRWTGGFQMLWQAIGALFLILVNASHAVAEDTAVDLSAGLSDAFTPYVLERNKLWVILPIFILGISLIHLRKDRRKQTRRKIKV